MVTQAAQQTRLQGLSVPVAPAAWLTPAAVVVCTLSVAMAAAAARGEAAFGRGLLQLLVVAGPIAVGLYALRAPANRSFGLALLGIGFAWSLTALAESSSSVPHTVGRLATWLTFPCVTYVLLAFPHGRIRPGLDRAVFAGVLAVMAILFYGTAPLVQAFPTKTLWSTCLTDCPANALFVLDTQPAFLADLITVREWLVMLLWVGLFASMLRRWRAASPMQRRALGPVFVAGTLLGVAHYAHIVTRQLGLPADTVIALSSVWTFCIVGVCAAVLFGLVRRRTQLASVLAKLGVSLMSAGDRLSTRNALSAALADTTTDVLVRDPDTRRWCDAHGRPVAWPGPLPPDRAATLIGDAGREPDMALLHDVALLDDRELLDGVSGLVLAGRRHERLGGELAAAMHELEDSRRRIAEAADTERARIERDLHDGAQQRLVALRIRLALAEEQLERDPAGGAKAIHDLGIEAERALDELRSLAHGIYPAVLTDRGLAGALASVAAQTPMPVRASVGGIGRHAIEVESAVYFTCAEALQNALKHAAGAQGAWVELRERAGRLEFEVGDDGPGFAAPATDGRGLRNMHDRIEAVGGELAVTSKPGRGTRVRGWVPI